jgi:glycosyltransferase involved in cell wall biosynthesis
MRHPRISLYDLNKAALKVKKMLWGDVSTKKYAPEGLHIKVLQPLMFPFLNFPGVRKFNRFTVLNAVRKNMIKLHMQAPILVITAPNAYDYIGFCGERQVVYYCVDDFAEWPGLNKKLVQQMEAELMSKANVFIATSDELFTRIARVNSNTNLLTHGVDYEFFSNHPRSEHTLLRDIPRPRVGYFGLFDQRNDQFLLDKIASQMGDTSFVITGDIATDVTKLRKHKNVYFTGGIPYQELPAMAKGYDLCMLPYKINKLTEAIQPLKIKEYLATGKPVISTPIKEALNLNNFVTIAKTPDDWILNIRSILQSNPSTLSKSLNSFLSKESWAKKSEEFLHLCLQGL